MPLAQSQGGAAGSSLDYYINYLTNPNQPGYYDETDTRAAEQAAGAGGQGFSGARGSLLRRSQRETAIKTVLPLLQQRAEFSHQTASQTQAEQARLQQIAAEAKSAMERDQLREQGLLRHDTAELAQRDKESIRAGNDAMQRLQLSTISNEREGAAGRQSAEMIAANRNASSNWQFQVGEQNRSATSEADRALRMKELNYNVAMKRSMAPGTWDTKGEDDLVNQIIQSNSLTKTAPSAAPARYSYDGSGGGSSVNYGSPQGPNEGTGEGTVSQPSYFFGENSPQTNALGRQNNSSPMNYWNIDDPYDEGG